MVSKGLTVPIFFFATGAWEFGHDFWKHRIGRDRGIKIVDVEKWAPATPCKTSASLEATDRWWCSRRWDRALWGFRIESSTQNMYACASYILLRIWLTFYKSSTCEYSRLSVWYPGHLSIVVVVLVCIHHNLEITFAQNSHTFSSAQLFLNSSMPNCHMPHLIWKHITWGNISKFNAIIGFRGESTSNGRDWGLFQNPHDRAE